MIEHIKFETPLNSSNSINIVQKDIKPVYILCQNSIISNQNIDIKSLVNNQLSEEEKNCINSLKINFTSDEIMSLQLNKKDFYIIEKSFLIFNLDFKSEYINQPNIFYFTDDSLQKYLFFPNEGKILKILHENAIIDMNADKRTNILTILILLYANEKELKKLFKIKITDEYDFKKYYLVNKKWIDNFKSFFKYNEICKLLSKISQFNNYKGYEKNIEKFLYKNEINTFGVNFNQIYNSFYNEINLYPEVNNEPKELYQFKCPINFQLVPKSLFILIKSIHKNTNEINYLKLKNKMLIGNSNLYLQDNTNPNIFYIFYFSKDNNTFNLFSILNFMKENYFYKIIYLFLKEENFLTYIIKKNYDTNKINVSQDILI